MVASKALAGITTTAGIPAHRTTITIIDP